MTCTSGAVPVVTHARVVVVVVVDAVCLSPRTRRRVASPASVRALMGRVCRRRRRRRRRRVRVE